MSGIPNCVFLCVEFIMIFSSQIHFSLFYSILYFLPACLCATPNFDFDSSPSFPREDFLSNDKRLKKSAELFEAALYTQATESYQDLLNELLPKSPEDKAFLLVMETRFHLANTYFTLEKYAEASAILDENIKVDPKNLSLNAEKIRQHSLYLKALSLKNSQQNEEAKKNFTLYLNLDLPSSLTFFDESHFEIGLIDFLNHKYQEASKSFSSLNIEKTKPRLFILSRLYLARIAQQQRNHKEAAKILSLLESKISNEDPLYFELNYLQGDTAFALHDYSKALEYFNKALPLISPEKYPWFADTLYHQGWCYLKNGENEVKEQDQKTHYFKKAEETFNQLASIKSDEKSYLALAQCYLSQAKRLKKPEFYAKAEELLSNQEVYTSTKAKAHALLLRAEAAPAYAIRDQIYRQLTKETEEPNIFYAKGWYMRALNEFEQGQTLLETQNSNASRNAFERSAEAFRTSFDLLKTQEPEQAGAALKYQALAISYLNNADSDKKALKILEELMKDHLPIWQALPNKDEIYYLHGYFAGRSAQEKDQENSLEIAFKSLQAASAIPNNSFGDQALHYLGSLYYQHKDYKKAEETYLQLIKEYPNSSLAVEAWLWAACCSDNLEEDPKISKERRQYTFEHFPTSLYAAEAYFTYFTYPEYLQGDRTAIKHLQSFTDLYSETPFLIDAYYLMGFDYKRDRKTKEGRWIRKKVLPTR